MHLGTCRNSHLGGFLSRMRRIVLALVALGVALYIAKAAAPLIVLGVMGLMLLAWKRPETVGWLAERPQLARLPAPMRATPMRFAATIAFASFVLIGLTLPLDATGTNPEPSATARATVAAATDESTSTPRPSPTARPIARPHARPTPRPTATPEPTPALGEAPTGPTQAGTVVSVTDGDTIRVNIDGVEYPVRYIGVSTPEIRNPVEWLGREAAAANAHLVEGREVVLEKDVSETDQFDRLLRHVWVDDGSGYLLVNLELVRLGFAKVTPYPPDLTYIDELYRPAEEQARAAGVGLWASPPTSAPTAPAAAAPTPPPAVIQPLVPPAATCEPSYPGICIAIGSADLDCGDIAWRQFAVVWNVPSPDPHRFDGDADGIGCES